MKTLKLALVSFMVLTATAALAASPVYNLPWRSESRDYKLLDEGRLAIDLAFRAPTLLYEIQANRMYALNDASTEVQGVYERKSAKEFYYFTQELDEKRNHVEQRIEGYGYESMPLYQVFSKTLYEGSMSGDSEYKAVVSPDDSKLYLWRQYEHSLLALDFASGEIETVLSVPSMEGKLLFDMRFVELGGKEALALISSSGYEQSTVTWVDVNAKTTLLTLTGYDFGRRKANPDIEEPYNPEAVIDSQGLRGVFCDHDSCVLGDLTTKKILKSFPLEDGNNSTTRFSTDGKILYVCNAIKNTLSTWKAEGATEIDSLSVNTCDTEGLNQKVGDAYLLQNWDQIYSFSAEGKLLDTLKEDDSPDYFTSALLTGKAKDKASLMTIKSDGAIQAHVIKLQ